MQFLATITHMANTHQTISHHRHGQHDQRGLVLFSWLLVIVLAVLIFFMSSRDADELNYETGFVSFVKGWLMQEASKVFGHSVDVSPVGHFTEFCLLGAALANALRWHLPLRQSLGVAVLLGSLYGITDEIHQLFVPGRSCDPADWLVDTIATTVGALLITLYIKHRTGNAEKKGETHGQ